MMFSRALKGEWQAERIKIDERIPRASMRTIQLASTIVIMRKVDIQNRLMITFFIVDVGMWDRCKEE